MWGGWEKTLRPHGLHIRNFGGGIQHHRGIRRTKFGIRTVKCILSCGFEVTLQVEGWFRALFEGNIELWVGSLGEMIANPDTVSFNFGDCEPSAKSSMVATRCVTSGM